MKTTTKEPTMWKSSEAIAEHGVRCYVNYRLANGKVEYAPERFTSYRAAQRHARALNA